MIFGIAAHMDEDNNTPSPYYYPKYADGESVGQRALVIC